MMAGDDAAKRQGEVPLEVRVKECQNGELPALEEVYRRTHALVRKLAFPLVRPHQVDDVVQEVFVVVHKRLHQLQKPSSFLAWLSRITIHVCHDMRKREPKAVEVRESDEARDDTERVALSLDLREALRALPEKDRNILLLRDLLGLSYEEIAYALKLRLGTVRSRIHYSRKKLMKRLAKSR